MVPITTRLATVSHRVSYMRQLWALLKKHLMERLRCYARTTCELIVAVAIYCILLLLEIALVQEDSKRSDVVRYLSIIYIYVRLSAVTWCFCFFFKGLSAFVYLQVTRRNINGGGAVVMFTPDNEYTRILTKYVCSEEKDSLFCKYLLDIFVFAFLCR